MCVYINETHTRKQCINIKFCIQKYMCLASHSKYLHKNVHPTKLKEKKNIWEDESFAFLLPFSSLLVPEYCISLYLSFCCFLRVIPIFFLFSTSSTFFFSFAASSSSTSLASSTSSCLCFNFTRHIIMWMYNICECYIDLR